MKLPLFLLPSADRDLEAIADDLADRAGVEEGLRFFEEFYECCSLISSHPQIGWATKRKGEGLAETRTIRVSSRFDKYLIFYLLRGQRIEVLRVLHGSQDLDAILPKGN